MPDDLTEILTDTPAGRWMPAILLLEQVRNALDDLGANEERDDTDAIARKLWARMTQED